MTETPRLGRAWPSRLPPVSPFALPTETTGRFRLLIAFAFAATWGLVASLIDIPPSFGVRQVSDETRDLVSRIAIHGLTDADAALIYEWARESGFFLAVGRHVWRSAIATVALLVLAAGAARLGQALDRRRRRRHSRLDPAEAPRVVAEIRELSRAATGRPPPEITVHDGYLDGLLFGETGRETLVLSGTPRQLERSWGDLHRAVVLHELGHWANGDLRWRERARCLLVVLGAFVVAAPVAMAAIRRPPLETVASSAIETAVVLALAWALWSGLVRSREIEADWRVIAWGEGQALRRRLSLESATEAAAAGMEGRFKEPRAFLEHLWRWRPWRFHPDNRKRLEAAGDPRRLFELRPGLALVTGIAIAVVASRLAPATLDFHAATALGTAPFAGGPELILVLLPALFLAVTLLFFVAADLVAGAVGMQAMRRSLLELADRQSRRQPLLGPAALLAVGLELGVWIFFGRPPRTASDLIACAAWLTAMTSLFWLWLRYVTALARSIFGHWAGPGTPTLAVRLARAGSAVFLCLTIWPAALARSLIGAVGGPDALAAVMGSIRPVGLQPGDTGRMLLVSGVVGLALAALFGVTGLAVAWAVPRLRGRHCRRCGHGAGRGPLIGRSCPACGAPLAAWAAFGTAALLRALPRDEARSAPTTYTAAKVAVLALGLAAAAWLPLALLSIASPLLPGIDDVEPYGVAERFIVEDPTGAFWLSAVGLWVLPAGALGAVAWSLWRRIARRERQARQHATPERTKTPDRWSPTVLRSAATLAALAGSVVLLVAAFASWSGFVFEAERTDLAIRWSRAAIAGFYFGWIGAVLWFGAVALIRIERDRRRWSERHAHG